MKELQKNSSKEPQRLQNGNEDAQKLHKSVDSTSQDNDKSLDFTVQPVPDGRLSLPSIPLPLHSSSLNPLLPSISLFPSRWNNGFGVETYRGLGLCVLNSLLNSCTYLRTHARARAPRTHTGINSGRAIILRAKDAQEMHLWIEGIMLAKMQASNLLT